VEIEVSGAEVHGVLVEVLGLVDHEGGVDGILVDDKGIGLNKVSVHHVVGLGAVLVVIVLVADVLTGVASEKGSESVAVVFDAARFLVLLMELLITLVTVRDVLRVIGVVVMSEGIVLGVDWLVVMVEAVLRDVLLVILVVSVVLLAVAATVSLAIFGLLVHKALKFHTVGSESVTGCGSSEAKHTSGENGGGEGHSENTTVNLNYYYNQPTHISLNSI